METTTFTALCERAGRWWTIRVPQVEGLTAQVRSLDQAEIIARQSIARALGVPPETIKVDVLPDAPAPVAHALQVRHTARLAVAAAMARRMRSVCDRIANFPGPVLAALNGHTLGGGAEVAAIDCVSLALYTLYRRPAALRVRTLCPTPSAPGSSRSSRRSCPRTPA